MNSPYSRCGWGRRRRQGLDADMGKVADSRDEIKRQRACEDEAEGFLKKKKRDVLDAHDEALHRRGLAFLHEAATNTTGYIEQQASQKRAGRMLSVE